MEKEENKNQNVPQKSLHAEREERILAKWNKEQTFKKSLDKPAPKGEFTFYDGPPFATGLPHYGHFVPGTIKDVVPRYKTMQGYKVRRRWGWDCHGLPVENLIEKDLNLKSKKDILNYGIGRFNEAARARVMQYANEWRKIVPRLGRWVDMDNDYRTMDSTYTESVWWVFGELYKKHLIYEDFKSMFLCPRCETTLSNFEVNLGYKDIVDLSVFVKFKNADGDYLLAWTTTPWTLPGNVALAVNPDIDYVKIKIESENYVLAKSRLGVLKDKSFEILATFKGRNLIGKAYTPIFDYYFNDKKLDNRQNGWKVYGADFVTTDDGSGIVHIAPAFGEDDYGMLKKHNLPFVQHVSVDGHFKAEVSDFAGRSVKPIDTAEDKNAHQATDIEIIKWLAHNNFLFEKEKITHSYPHCWRCDTPLINYAASSWFVKVTDIKDKLVKENNKVDWVPPEIGTARFGNWLEGARDWAISRSRFWGAPLPVWRRNSESRGRSAAHENIVISSVADLKKYSKSKNTYYIMRHGESENNVRNILSGNKDDKYGLTENGKKQVIHSAANLRNKKIDLIYSSPFVRTEETANIVKKELALTSPIIFDERLGELKSGEWSGKDVFQFLKEFPVEKRFDSAPEGGETYMEIKRRVGDFIYDIENKHNGKTILIVAHETPVILLQAVSAGLDRQHTIKLFSGELIFGNAECRELDFSPLPHNSDYELDLHRPYIDDLQMSDEKGEKLVRVPDVFDCWFESGSMPYGEVHYPFEKNSDFDPWGSLFGKTKGFPADFIAEAIDQTRGWFYSMLVLGVALFGKSPFKKVIVNGLVLAEDGQKLSKKTRNYADPITIFEKYGADSLRFYLLSSPVVRGQDLLFSEKGVDEVTKKIVNRLNNVVSFYEMFAQNITLPHNSNNVLDIWITSRLSQTISAVTIGLEAGELDRASRPFYDFLDDLSTWYIRRSRDRFKSDDESDRLAALSTTKFVIIETAKLLAPFMPFLAEDVYQRVCSAESVHLESWPKASAIEDIILNQMILARAISSKGLEARTVSKINVRQPLSSLKVKDAASLSQQLIDLIKDEVNVKTVEFGANISKDVELDLNITEELKAEGDFRELMRKIQDARKEAGLKVGEMAVLNALESDRELINQNIEQVKKLGFLKGVVFGETFDINK